MNPNSVTNILFFSVISLLRCSCVALLTGTVKDGRVSKTDQAMQFIHMMRPLFSKMMVMGSNVPFEDMQLSGHCFSSLLWER